jgi:hypothetical protein
MYCNRKYLLTSMVSVIGQISEANVHSCLLTYHVCVMELQEINQASKEK